MEKAISARSGLFTKLMSIKENRWIERLLPVAILAVLAVIFTVTTNGRFATQKNIKIIMDQSLIVATVATGASFIYGSGNVNIAMGACTALTATVAAKVYLATESVITMVASALFFGVFLMTVCALLSTIFNVRVMFVTIVMMVLLANIKAVILKGESIVFPYELISTLQRSNISYIIFGAYFVFCYIIFHHTKVGRAIRFVGSNVVCSEQTGISPKKWLMVAFLISGIGVGLGAFLVIIRSGTITSSTVGSLNMDCMLAIVLGGMPIYGGSRSRSYAALIGAMTVSVLNNGLLMMGVDATVLQGVRGLLFLILVLAGSERPELLPSRE